CAAAHRRETARGRPGRSNGPRPLRRPRTALRPCLRSRAGGRCGTCSIPTTRTDSMNSTGSRGRAGVIGFIVAETSLFAVFVVAYLFYIGKSPTGPFPTDVLELPILGTICLLSISVTVALATCAFAAGRDGRAGDRLV